MPNEQDQRAWEQGPEGIHVHHLVLPQPPPPSVKTLQPAWHSGCYTPIAFPTDCDKCRESLFTPLRGTAW